MSWKSLDQIYLNESAGKKIKKLPRQEIIGEVYDVKFKKESDTEYTDLKVGDDQFTKAARYLKVNSDLINPGIDKLKETGLNDKQIKELLNVVYDYDEPEKFFNALNNQINADDFLNAPDGDVISLIANKFGLDTNLVIDLLRFEPATKPSTGKGEVFMMTFIDGAKKGSVGDVDINGVEYEVKGTNARIRGQRGFGAQTAGARAFLNGLKQLIQKSGLKLDVGTPNFNIQVNSNGFIDQVANELVATGKVTKEDIAQLYANGLKEVYENADIENDLLSWIRNDLDDNGNMTEDFKRDYFLFALKYYASQENFSYLVTMGTAPSPKFLFGKMKFVSRDEIFDGSILDRVQPDSYPSFLPGAGAQGGQFSIRPNVK